MFYTTYLRRLTHDSLTEKSHRGLYFPSVSVRMIVNLYFYVSSKHSPLRCIMLAVFFEKYLSSWLLTAIHRNSISRKICTVCFTFHVFIHLWTKVYVSYMIKYIKCIIQSSIKFLNEKTIKCPFQYMLIDLFASDTIFVKWINKNIPGSCGFFLLITYSACLSDSEALLYLFCVKSI